MSKTARDIMSTQLITVTPSTPLREFARICAEDGISGAPVLNIDDSLAGLITKSDLLEGVLQHEPGEQSMTDDWLGDDRQVGDLMVPANEVHAAEPGTPAAEIAERMASERIHRVLVLEEGRCVGIVTSLDLLRHYGA